MHFTRVFIACGNLPSERESEAQGLILCLARPSGPNTPVRVLERASRRITSNARPGCLRAGPDSVRVKSEPYRLLEKRNLERLYQMRADIRIEALAHAITPFTRVRRQSLRVADIVTDGLELMRRQA